MKITKLFEFEPHDIYSRPVHLMGPMGRAQSHAPQGASHLQDPPLAKMKEKEKRKKERKM